MSSRLWALLLMLSGNMLLDALEVSTIVIAMPSISHGLHLTPAATSWVMTAFALGFGGSILLGARLAAHLGRRRVYLSALLVFAFASIASGLATNLSTLIAARAVKGICVALTAPTGLAIIANTFPDGPHRNRAVSVYSLFGASGFSAGLILSGALTLLSWRWTLAVSGPIALALLLFGLNVIPRDNGSTPPRLTFPNATTLRSALGAAALNGPYWGFLLLTTFAAQRHWSPLLTGIALLPTSVPLMIASPFFGRMIRRFGAPRLITLGSLSAALAYVWYLAHPQLPPTTLLIGLAFLLAFGALHFQAISGVPPAEQGSVSGFYQTSVQLGGAVMLILVANIGQRAALPLIAAVALAGLVIAVRKGASCPPIPSRSLSS